MPIYTHHCSHDQYISHGSLTYLVLATGLSTLPLIRVWTGKTSRFGSRPVQEPNPLLLGGPNANPYQSTHRFRRVWHVPLGPISGSAFRGLLCMVAFRYPTVNLKISTMVCHCSIWMYWLPYKSPNGETCTQPLPGNEHQQSVNNFWSCVLYHLTGDWLQTVITDVLASIEGKRGCDALPATS